MITYEQIEQFEKLWKDERFDAGGPEVDVLSVYLSLEPARQVQRTYRTVFEDLVKALRDRLEPSRQSALAAEAARVQSWLEAHEPQGKGVTLFSCTPRGLWQAHVLSVPIKDHVAFEPHPDLAGLLDLLDEYERYIVAVVDKRKARLLSVFMGEIEAREAFEDFVPGKHDQGGVSQATYQRHHEAHVLWHLKRVVERLSQLLRQRQFDRLMLLGPEEAASELRGLLPHALARRLAAVVPGETYATDAEILERAAEVERGIERAAEQQLLHELLETAGAGGRATVGVAPTLDALWLGEIRTLVVSEGFHATGTECSNCGRLDADAGRIASCPACGSADRRPIHDVAHRAMGRVLEQAGRVEILHGDAAERLQQAGGGLGALLRFAVPGQTVATAASAAAGATASRPTETPHGHRMV